MTNISRNRLNFFLITLILFVINLSGCKKQGPQKYYFDNNLKSWTCFKNGSYWIYQNEKTLLFDTTVILSNGSLFSGSEDANQFEIIHSNIKSGFIREFSGFREPITSFFQIGLFYPEPGNPIALSSTVSNGGNDGFFTNEYQKFWCVERLDSLILNGNIFTNVIHTRNLIPGCDSLQDDFYFARNIGLIKCSIKTSKFDSTWSVIKYFVSQ